MHAYTATDLTRVGQRLDPGEELAPEICDLAKARRLLVTSAIRSRTPKRSRSSEFISPPKRDSIGQNRAAPVRKRSARLIHASMARECWEGEAPAEPLSEPRFASEWAVHPLSFKGEGRGEGKIGRTKGRALAKMTIPWPGEIENTHVNQTLPVLSDRLDRSPFSGRSVVSILLWTNILITCFAQCITGELGVFGSPITAGGAGLLHSLNTHGQIWRLITSQYLHWDTMHLLFNMLGLHFLGRQLELGLGKQPVFRRVYCLRTRSVTSSCSP